MYKELERLISQYKRDIESRDNLKKSLNMFENPYVGYYIKHKDRSEDTSIPLSNENNSITLFLTEQLYFLEKKITEHEERLEIFNKILNSLDKH